MSDSEDDDEEQNINVMELDDNSHLSADSRVSDSNSMQVGYSERSGQDTNTCELLTEFNKDMFPSENTEEQEEQPTDDKPIKVPKVEDFHTEFDIPETFAVPEIIDITKGNFFFLHFLHKKH